MTRYCASKGYNGSGRKLNTAKAHRARPACSPMRKRDPKRDPFEGANPLAGLPLADQEAVIRDAQGWDGDVSKLHFPTVDDFRRDPTGTPYDPADPFEGANPLPAADHDALTAAADGWDGDVSKLVFPTVDELRLA